MKLKFDLEKHWTDERKIKSFFTANLTLMIGGLASLAVGLWLYWTKNQFVELIPSSYSALSAAGLCVFSGITIIIISAVGYFGVVWNYKSLMLSYILFILLLIFVHGVARTTGFFHREEARDNLRMSLLRNINATHVVTKIGREIKLSVTWDHLQRELECCGVDSYTDWFYSVHWPMNRYTPDSCCDPDRFEIGDDSAHCGKMPNDDVVFRDGCFPKFADWLYHHIILVNWVTSLLLIVEIFLFALTIIVMRLLRRGMDKPPKRTNRREDQIPIPDDLSERFRLNPMDRVADANDDGTVEEGITVDAISMNSR